MAQSTFLRADMSNEQMIALIERFQALERNKNDGAFGSDLHQTIALLELLLQVAPILNTATAGDASAARTSCGSPLSWITSGTTCPTLSPWI